MYTKAEVVESATHGPNSTGKSYVYHFQVFFGCRIKKRNRVLKMSLK